ncbi:MAG: hypothetical protein RRC34_13820 [Lentisphaeria bacterium]|nr:hypothetical protein [Lentisphaeria bacterium]
MQRNIDKKNILFSLLIVLIMGLLCGCPNNNSQDDYRNQSLCYQDMRLALADIQNGFIVSDATERDWRPSNFTKYLHCPVSKEKYLFNPNLITWPDADEIAIVCSCLHTAENQKINKYLALTFDGRLTTLSALPTWAISQIEKNVKAGQPSDLLLTP